MYWGIYTVRKNGRLLSTGQYSRNGEFLFDRAVQFSANNPTLVVIVREVLR